MAKQFKFTKGNKKGRSYTVEAITPARIYYEDQDMQTGGSMPRDEFKHKITTREIQKISNG